MAARVSELWIYPIKSCRGVRLTEMQMDDRGPRLDRRWMLVDENNAFLSQRTLRRMALVDVRLEGERLIVSGPGLRPLQIESGSSAPPERCTIWQDSLELVPVGETADRWFSTLLGRYCRLMEMPARTRRRVDPAYGIWSDVVSLADAYPLLLVSQESLDLLNQTLRDTDQDPVPMQRFRPNVVVAGTLPHEEDAWLAFSVGPVPCRGVRLRSRCGVPPIDVATALAGKVGLGVIHDNCDSICVGDAVTVHRYGEHGPQGSAAPRLS